MYTPSYPTFIKEEMGLQCLYVIFLLLVQNINCDYSLEKKIFFFCYSKNSSSSAIPTLKLSRLPGKPTICITAKLISAFAFATRIEQSLYFLKRKFHASSCLLLSCSPVGVGPGRKPHCWSSHGAAQIGRFVFTFQ